MNTLDYIIRKYKLNTKVKMPVEIPNVGRNNLAELFAELGYRVGVEIGVQRGAYSEVLCAKNPRLKLYGVDPFVAYKGYDTKQRKFDRFYEQAKDKLRPYKNYRFIKKFSMDAVKDFKDGSIDFVYIDGNHNFRNVACDMFEWSKKVRSGGIVSGHDYCRRVYADDLPTSNHHVVYVVDAYMRAFRVHPWFVLGRKSKIPGEIRDFDRSWMFVKK